MVASPAQRRAAPIVIRPDKPKASPSARATANGQGTAKAAAAPPISKRTHRDDRDLKVIGPWRIGKTIGKGSSGRVKICKNVTTGQPAAVKIVPKQALLNSRMSLNEAGAKTEKALLGIEREIVIMKLIEHPNVLRLYDVWETGNDLYLVMEYAEGGELFDYLVSKGRLGADEALNYFQQIIHGVDYCHRFNICHRDLKPENLLLDSSGNIKIADFGMAALDRFDKLLETSCGSPHYASPEIVAGQPYHGASSDIWSCGIILFALLVGRLPFDDENIRNLLAKVKHGRFVMPSDLPTDAKDLISKMLEVDPTKRITMDKIQKHPWFTRRPPRTMGQTVTPPSAVQMTDPVPLSTLDYDILSNLQTLWQGTSEDEIVKALTSEGKSWFKVFYQLLVKYRQHHYEEFNMDEDEPMSPNPTQLSHPQVTAPSTMSRSHRSKGSLAELAAIPERQPSRPAPPAPSTKASKAPTSPRPLPLAPSTGRNVKSPPRIDLAIPSIQLQTASPEAPAPVKQPLPVADNAPPSPTPTQSSRVPVASTISSYSDGGDPLSHMQPVYSRPTSVASAPTPSHRSGSVKTQSTVMEDSPQFEDAEEEVSPYMSPNPFSPRASPQLGSPNPQLANRMSLRNPARSAMTRPGPRPNSAFGAVSAPIVSRRVQPSYEQENTAPRRGQVSNHGSEAKQFGLGLGIQSAGVPGMDMFGGAAVSSSKQSRRGHSPRLGTSTPVMGPIQVTKGSWFANLFSWKQPTFTLSSQAGLDVSRAECRHLLEAIGAFVVVENADSAGVLKCRVDTIQGQQLKPVKFRVEFSQHNSSWSPALDARSRSPCVVTLVMERGAHSTFKLVTSLLRNSWFLDSRGR